MNNIIAFVVLGLLCAQLSAQTVIDSLCGNDSTHCIVWNVEDGDLPDGPIDELVLFYDAPTGYKIKGPIEWVEGPCWFCEGERDQDWSVDFFLSQDSTSLEVRLNRLIEPIEGAGLVSGGTLIVILDDNISRVSPPINLLGNPSTSLKVDLGFSVTPGTLMSVKKVDGSQSHFYLITNGVNELPTQSLPDGIYYVSIPSMPFVEGKMWMKKN
ncbi:MAG: hypothetical protein AAFY71_21300 [Bacteroidota bacterium]